MLIPRSLAADVAAAPLGRVQSCTMTHVVSAASPSGDLRWTLAEFAARALSALDRVVERQLVGLARHTMARALQGARFAEA